MEKVAIGVDEDVLGLAPSFGPGRGLGENVLTVRTTDLSSFFSAWIVVMLGVSTRRRNAVMAGVERDVCIDHMHASTQNP